MVKETLDFMVVGGKATAGPPVGPALGPKGVNIGQIIAKINEKTSAVAGMSVPIKLIIDTETKEFTVEVGTPPTSALIKKELGSHAKGSATPKEEKTGDLPIDHVIRVAQAKQDALLAKNLKAATKEVLGTCKNMGILVEGKDPQIVQKEIDEGQYAEKFTGKLQFLDAGTMAAKQKPFLEVIAAQKARKAEAATAAPVAPTEEKKEGEVAKAEAPKEEKKKKK